MGVARGLYQALLPVAEAGAHVAATFLPKVREALDGRKGFHSRWEDLRTRLTTRPVWFHVASVGEFEQARPVIAALHARHPDIPILITFSSPSGYAFATRREKIGEGGIRFLDYLPVDRASNMRFCLACANPRALVFVKFDLWPNLVWEAHDRKIPVLLIDATLSPSSKRLSGVARALYRDVYACIDRILAISDEDAQRFAQSVPGHRHISVAGDTRFDRVMERWQKRGASTFSLPQDGLRTFIAGSTWPPDEARVLPALTRLLAEDTQLRAVIVPHEPTPAHVTPLLQWARDAGHPAQLSSAGAPDGARVVIVDKVGVLAEAYRFADVVYVGGAFTTGVHSVIEPAIAGVPVVFGPRYDNSFEAVTLLARGAATAIQTEADAYAALKRYLSDDAERARAGEAGRAYVESQLGATEKCMAALAPYL